MKIAIIYPFIDTRGGGNRVISTICRYFNADIFVGGYDQKIIEEDFKGCNIYQIANKRLIKNLFGREYLLALYSLKLKIPKSYDIIVVNNWSTSFASIRNRPAIFYVHNIDRFFYNCNSSINNRYNSTIRRVLSKLGILPGRILDQIIVKNFINCLIANSKNVREKLARIYRKKKEKIQLLYPPVNVNKFRFKSYEDFLLTVSRLEPYKRVELIIKAMKYVPDLKLKVVGTGSLYKYLRRIAPRNVEFLGSVSDEILVELYSRALATVYLPKNEDFGIVPVESMASGKICIGSNEGGLKETILHGETGFLIKPSLKNLVEVINKIKNMDLSQYREKCIRRAKMFSEEEFVKKFRRIVNKILQV